MDYIVFYNYANGERYFGYYGNYDEANKRYEEALEESKEFESSVEIGFAEIEKVKKVNWED